MWQGVWMLRDNRGAHEFIIEAIHAIETIPKMKSVNLFNRIRQLFTELRIIFRCWAHSQTEILLVLWITNASNQCSSLFGQCMIVNWLIQRQKSIWFKVNGSECEALVAGTNLTNQLISNGLLKIINFPSLLLVETVEKMWR